MLTVRNKQSGFTLIEVLLVIAILAILASLAISTYRRQFFSNKASQVSVEMQHVLEAAMAFNVDHQGEWPKTNNGIPACEPPSGLNNDFVRFYLPNANYQDSFGGNYCWGEEPTNKRLFWVAVKVPNNDIALAKQIASRLPNAVSTNSPNSKQFPVSPCGSGDCYVRAEITQPGTTSNRLAGGDIVAVGNCQAPNVIQNTGGGVCRDDSTTGEQEYQITFTGCPDDQTPRLVIWPNFYSGPNVDQGASLQIMNAQQVGVCSSTGCEAKVTMKFCGRGGHCFSDPSHQLDIKAHSGSVGASYLVVCEGGER